MRTKTLLLTAALSAAGIATSMAQVYSVNAVGYVNTTIVPGFNLISNPLDNKSAAGNTVANLFLSGTTTGTIPPATTVYVFKNGNFVLAEYDDLTNEFIGAAATEVIAPGNGVFVRNTGTANFTVTFVGEVPQGNLSNPLPAGFSIKANQVPQEGAVDALGANQNLPANAGDTIYFYDEVARNYEQPRAFDDLTNEWVPALRPLQVGEAFFLFRTQAGTWNRTFNVNQ